MGDTVVGGRQTGWTKSMHNLTNDEQKFKYDP